MTRLYIIRHAEAEGNLYRIAQGQLDRTLTAKGNLQVDALAERFKDIKIDALYSSDLTRAKQTAGAILKYHELELNTDARLREINVGICEGMSFGNMKKLDPESMYLFYNDPDKWRGEGAETFAQCTERMLKAVCDIAEANDGRTVAIVSHGMVIRSLLARVMNIKSEDIYKVAHADNTAVSLLNYENGEFAVEFFNDNSHLPEGLSVAKTTSGTHEASDGRNTLNLSYEPFDPRENPETYKAYYESAWLAAHGNLVNYSPDFFLKAAQRRFERDGESVVGVYNDNELIGILELDSEKGRHADYGWISLVCLKEEYRGKGLGIQPVGYAINYYQLRGRNALRLHVSSENKHALGFYEHYGFKRLSEEAGAGAPIYLMEKKIR